MKKIFLFVVVLAAFSCKSKDKKDPCYDNHDVKQCESKCFKGEKKACEIWCRSSESVEACDKACKLKHEPSCKIADRLKKEEKGLVKKDKKLEANIKALEPYCTEGCNDGSKQKSSSSFGYLTWVKLENKAKANAGKTTISACIEDCTKEMSEKCPSADFKKQYPDQCKLVK